MGENPNVFFVHKDCQLLSLLISPEIDIYMYRGGAGLVVANGDGQNPLAILDPFYQWEIESDKTSGRFLVRTSIIGHKGSYGYKRKDNAC